MRSKIVKYLDTSRTLQLATVGGDDQPWVCTVYFVADENLDIYWLSWPNRRHSVELASNPKAAVTMAIKTDLPVIGLGAEGEVDIVRDIKTIEQVLPLYIEKYDSGRDFIKRVKNGTNTHELYRLKVNKFVLFDEVNHPGEGSIEYSV